MCKKNTFGGTSALREFQLYIEIVVFNFYTEFLLKKFLLIKSAPNIKLDCFKTNPSAPFTQRLHPPPSAENFDKYS